MRLVTLDATVRADLEAGVYDHVVCHTVRSLLWMWRYRRPHFFFCAHIPLWSHTPVARLKSAIKRDIVRAFARGHSLTFVPTSRLKKETWRVPESAILTTAEPMPEATFEVRDRALLVCNGMTSRRDELGSTLTRQVGALVGLQLVGRGNGPGSAEPATYAEFLDLVRRFGVYFYPIASPWGDGYNIALLEAMRMGMAIVTVAHPHSPIEDGVSGLVGRTPEELAAKIRTLLGDDRLARILGKGARRAFDDRFGAERFARAWSDLLEESVVTVVVTTFNAAAFVERTLSSVAAQSYRTFECIVVDDGSADGTAAIVREFCARDARFRLVETTHGGVPGRTRNLGCREAKGEYLAFLDHDDFWHPEKLARQVEAYRVTPDAAFVHTARERWRALGAPPAPAPVGSARPKIQSFRRALGQACRVTYSSVMTTRLAFIESGGFDESLRAVEDYDLFLRLARRRRIVRLGKRLTFVYEHGENLSRSKPTMVDGLKRLAAKAKGDGSAPALARSLEAQALKSEGVMLLGTDAKAARLAFARSLKAQFRLKTLALWLGAPALRRP